MTEPAVGIHNHPVLKLGARTGSLASNTPVLHARDFLTAVPAHPVADPIPGFTYPMDRNDQAGDCVVASGDHALQIVGTLLTGAYVNWSDAQLLRAYQSQNPGFTSWTDAGGPNDQGMDVQQFLSWMVKQGFILGFAKIDPTSEDEVKAAIWLFLAVITGQDMQVAQQSGDVWDYVKGSASWGGHATVWGGFPGSPDDIDTVSWGAVYEMTQAFVQHQVTEAYVIITQAHVDHAAFREGFDLVKFGEAFTQLTGRAFPVVVPTPPVPTPVPVPVPPQPNPEPVDVDTQLADAAKVWLKHRWHTHAQTEGLRGALTDWLDVHYPSNGNGGRHSA